MSRMRTGLNRRFVRRRRRRFSGRIYNSRRNSTTVTFVRPASQIATYSRDPSSIANSWRVTSYSPLNGIDGDISHSESKPSPQGFGFPKTRPRLSIFAGTGGGLAAAREDGGVIRRWAAAPEKGDDANEGANVDDRTDDSRREEIMQQIRSYEKDAREHLRRALDPEDSDRSSAAHQALRFVQQALERYEEIESDDASLKNLKDGFIRLAVDIYRISIELTTEPHRVTAHAKKTIKLLDENEISDREDLLAKIYRQAILSYERHASIAFGQFQYNLRNGHMDSAAERISYILSYLRRASHFYLDLRQIETDLPPFYWQSNRRYLWMVNFSTEVINNFRQPFRLADRIRALAMIHRLNGQEAAAERLEGENESLLRLQAAAKEREWSESAFNNIYTLRDYIGDEGMRALIESESLRDIMNVDQSRFYRGKQSDYRFLTIGRWIATGRIVVSDGSERRLMLGRADIGFPRDKDASRGLQAVLQEMLRLLFIDDTSINLKRSQLIDNMIEIFSSSDAEINQDIFDLAKQLKTVVDEASNWQSGFDVSNFGERLDEALDEAGDKQIVSSSSDGGFRDDFSGLLSAVRLFCQILRTTRIRKLDLADSEVTVSDDGQSTDTETSKRITKIDINSPREAEIERKKARAFSLLEQGHDSESRPIIDEIIGAFIEAGEISRASRFMEKVDRPAAAEALRKAIQPPERKAATRRKRPLEID